MINRKELETLSKMSFNEVDKNDIPELKDIKIDTSLSPEDRITAYLKTVKNPYFLRCGDSIIKMSFSDKGNTVQQLFSEIIKRKKAENF